MSLGKRVGTELIVDLHPGQMRAQASTARFVAVIAGFQGGKTSYGPWWLYNEIQRTRVPGEDNDYLASSATYDLLELKMLPEMIQVFVNDLRLFDYRPGNMTFVMRGDPKTRIILRSGVKPSAIESATARAAWCDEWGQDQVPLESWDALQRRLAIHRGRVLITTTPYNIGWLKQQVYDKWLGGNPDYDVINFRSCDNPVFPITEYERLRSVLPDWKFQMFCNGLFTRPAGLIYSDYDESIHCVKLFSIPAEWKRAVGIDFGMVNTALVWIAERPIEDATLYPDGKPIPGLPGDYYIYREKHAGDLTGPQHAREALEYKEPVRRWLGGSASEDAQRADWAAVGCPVQLPGIQDVEAGIDRVIGLFKRRRLYVFETIYGLRSELGTYSRKLDDAGECLDAIKDKEKFHRIDALRYGCSEYSIHEPNRVLPEPIGLFSVAWQEKQRRKRKRR